VRQCLSFSVNCNKAKPKKNTDFTLKPVHKLRVNLQNLRYTAFNFQVIFQ
jgi:hypothetical protein